MKIGTNDISKIYLGGAEIEKIYLGTEDVYDGGDTPTPPTPVPYSGQYLTIESTSNNNTIYWKSNYVSQFKTISASTDNGSTWTAYTSTSGNGTTIATLNSGDTIIFKGENAQYNSRGTFKSTSSFITYGNVMSLVYGDNFSGQTTLTSGDTFNSLFSDCSGLTSAENLILPATTLAQYCYCGMFGNCTSLTTTPELPATTLANGCYGSMFFDCSSLTVAPDLPATTLVISCYQEMFNGCTSLTVAPELPATTLADYCYQGMFGYCTSLNSITCLATDISATDCTSYWVDGVAASGSFFVPSGNPASWECGVNGVPSDWTIEDTNGDTYECTGSGGGEPSTDVPLENGFAVKVNGVWNEIESYVSDINEIESYLGNFDISPSDVEELSIGNKGHRINLDGENWGSCTGLTLAPNITETSDIHKFPAMQWVNVMGSHLEYNGVSGLFSDMNCCPIYVPEMDFEGYQRNWENETTDDCDGSVADRLVAWTENINPDPGN